MKKIKVQSKKPVRIRKINLQLFATSSDEER